MNKFFGLKKTAPHLYIGFLLFVFVTTLIDDMWVNSIQELSGLLEEVDPYGYPFKGTVQSLGVLVVWGAYFMKSKRVKNTFVKKDDNVQKEYKSNKKSFMWWSPVVIKVFLFEKYSKWGLTTTIGVVLLFVVAVIVAVGLSSAPISNEKAVLKDFKNVDFNMDLEDSDNYGIKYNNGEPSTDFVKEYLALFNNNNQKVIDLGSLFDANLSEIGIYYPEDLEEFVDISELGILKQRAFLAKDEYITFIWGLYDILEKVDSELLSLSEKYSVGVSADEIEKLLGDCSFSTFLPAYNSLEDNTVEYFDSYIYFLDFLIENNGGAFINESGVIDFSDESLYKEALDLSLVLFDKEEAFYNAVADRMSSDELCVEKSKEIIEQL